MFKNTDTSGFTVSMWAKQDSSTLEDSALFEAKTSSSYDNLPMTSLHAGAFADYRSQKSLDKWK